MQVRKFFIFIIAIIIGCSSPAPKKIEKPQTPRLVKNSSNSTANDLKVKNLTFSYYWMDKIEYQAVLRALKSHTQVVKNNLTTTHQQSVTAKISPHSYGLDLEIIPYISDDKEYIALKCMFFHRSRISSFENNQSRIPNKSYLFIDINNLNDNKQNLFVIVGVDVQSQKKVTLEIDSGQATSDFIEAIGIDWQ